MFSSLYTKLAAVLLGLFFLVGVSLVLMSVYAIDMYQQEVNQQLNHDVAGLIVKEKLLMQENKVNQKAFAEIFHMLMVINPSIEIYLLDPEGKILAFSANPGKVKREVVDIGPVKRFLSDHSDYPLMGDDPRDSRKRKVFTAARITQKGRLEGYLYIILGGEIYDSIIHKLQKSYILRLTIWFIVACLVVAAVAGLIVFASLTRRLRRLSAAVESYNKIGLPGQLEIPFETWKEKGDEIDQLATTFSAMAQRIEDQVASLKAADSQRRELVANVSHDLRTPLATLQGYIETLVMKNRELTAEERGRYLKVAMGHCNRLDKLVSGLFELAKLESNDVKAKQEPFNLAELVNDVIQKFQLAAGKKNIRIIVKDGQDLPRVLADIALIERALENLLSNALTHASEGGNIVVELEADDKNVSVGVSDNGPGIPAEELGFIFERYYQADPNRETNAGHSGLGLAITNQIIDLHGSTINVESELNVGTTFRFTLPIYRDAFD